MKRLEYMVKIDPNTREPLGPDAARMFEEIARHYGGCFVAITVIGIPNDKDYRGAYFASVIPRFLEEALDAGYDVDPQNREHKNRAHQYFKDQFNEGNTTSGFTAEQWRQYLRKIDYWMSTFFTKQPTK